MRRILLANLAAQIGIVVTGGLVRLTGSGLGCPSWPQCRPGSYTPVLTAERDYHELIEYGNRMLTFAVVAASVAALLATRRIPESAPRALAVRRFGPVPLVGVFAQAGLGGVTVLTALHPATVAAHFLLSMGLIAVSTLLVIWATPSGVATPPMTRSREVAWLGWATVVVAAGVLVLGTVVTGSGPHSGDADAPARFGLDPRTASWVHADAVWLFCGLVVALLLAQRLTGAGSRARRRTWWLAAITAAQGTVGYVQYATDLPIAVVAGHMLGAALLVVAVTAVAEATVGRPHSPSPA